MYYIEDKKQGVIVKIYVKPMRSENKLVVKDDELIFYSKEKPVKGRVNASLLKFLSRRLDIASTDIEILSGIRDRFKVIMIKGITKKDFIEKMFR
jgi:hypothetical protein